MTKLFEMDLISTLSSEQHQKLQEEMVLLYRTVKEICHEHVTAVELERTLQLSGYKPNSIKQILESTFHSNTHKIMANG